MDKQGKLDYSYGDWNTAETNTEADTVGETAAGTGTGRHRQKPAAVGAAAEVQRISRPKAMNKYKYKVGKYTHKSRDYSKVAANISNRAQGGCRRRQA